MVLLNRISEMTSSAPPKSSSTRRILFTVACSRSAISAGYDTRSTPSMRPAAAMNESSSSLSEDADVSVSSNESSSGFSGRISSNELPNILRNSSSSAFSSLAE